MAHGSKRPLSPHLQIYRLPFTALTSVIHRGTGVGLAIGTLLLVWWLVSAALGPQAFATAQAFLGSPLGYLILLGWSWCLFYHLCNGIRHLVWDAGWGFDMPNIDMGAIMVVGVSVVLTVVAWVAALMTMPK